MQASAAGDLGVRAVESTQLKAEDTSSVSAGDIGLNAVVATNTVLGGARAWVRGGSLTTTAGGDVRLQS
ncbi:MAG: hypothetical protein ACKOV8_09755, partial [Phycisphaerales bacterium]